MASFRLFLGFAIVLLSLPAPVAAQTMARFGVDSVAAVDLFRGESMPDRPNILVDITATVRIGDGWTAYVHPWLRQPRDASWDVEIYQAAVRYQRAGAVATRVDLGYIASPVGLGMMDTLPNENPTIQSHLSYFVPMPSFDPGAPRVRPIAATYPLGGQVTVSTTKWDARAALLNSAPTRIFAINRDGNPHATPVVVAGGGVTPRIGLRLGAAIAHGDYVTGDELAVPQDHGRRLTLAAFEAEYEIGRTKVTGELTRDRMETADGTAIAYAWFVQGTHDLSARWWLAGRQEGASSPPLNQESVSRPRAAFLITEAAVGYRVTRDLALRTSLVTRKSFTATAWERQFGVSAVWAHRWW